MSIATSVQKITPPDKCTTSPNTARFCVNCKGDHAACWRGCPKVPKKNPYSKPINLDLQRLPKQKITLDEKVNDNPSQIPSVEPSFNNQKLIYANSTKKSINHPKMPPAITD
ncbi:hypothetical protein CDAR_494251 [Caerostris darwini]|uniref:Uncharacterized protein n=1 Tax=Caerostris darwini TaxID=1538125 RepID=A0AAV4TMW4_9ARAC|nr:hypothetical protein CDAR_494251 [Caerostris darwini]